MCKVIGKRLGLTPAMETECDRFLGRDIGEGLKMGLATYLPEGLIIQLETGEVMISNRCTLEPCHEEKMTDRKRAHPARVTAADLDFWITEAKMLISRLEGDAP